MIVVHHLENSRSQRVVWLLEELGVPYEIKKYRRDPKTMLAPPELRAVHPLGKSPVIVDGDLVLAESGAIAEYCVERHGQGRLSPALGSLERTRYLHWLHYAEGSLMPLLLMRLIFSRIAPGSPAIVRPIARGIVGAVHSKFLDPQLKLHLDYIEGELGKNEWFAGNAFTAADIQMSFPLEAAAARARACEGRPAITAFLERIHARPAHQRALAKGGAFEILR